MKKPQDLGVLIAGLALLGVGAKGDLSGPVVTGAAVGVIAMSGGFLAKILGGKKKDESPAPAPAAPKAKTASPLVPPPAAAPKAAPLVPPPPAPAVPLAAPVAPPVAPPPPVAAPVAPPPVAPPPVVPSAANLEIDPPAAPVLDLDQAETDVTALFPPEPAAPAAPAPAAPLFDENALDQELDSLFGDAPQPAAPPAAEGSGLFDPNKLDASLDDLFKEAASLPPEPEPVAQAPAASGGLFDPNQLDASLDNLFGGGLGEAPAAQADHAPEPTPVAEAPAAGGLFDPNKLDASLDDLFKEPGEAPAAQAETVAEPLPAVELPAATMEVSPPPAAGGLFDPDKLDASLDNLFGGGLGEPVLPGEAPVAPADQVSEPIAPAPVAEPEPAPIEIKAAEPPAFDPGLTLTNFDLSGFSLEEAPGPTTVDAPEAAPEAPAAQAPAPEPVAPPPMPEPEPVAQAPEPATQPAPQPDGLISIGKLLVNQNTLEEIIKKAEASGAGLSTTQVISAAKGQTLDTLLGDVNRLPGVLGSLIVGRDGLVITNTMPADIDKDLVGALTSSLFANVELQVKRMQRGLLKRLVVDTDLGLSVLAPLEMGTLVVFTKDEADLGSVLTAVAAISGKK